MLFRKCWSKQPTIVKGKAVSLINIAMLIGQGGAALLVGPIVDAVGDKRIIIVSIHERLGNTLGNSVVSTKPNS